VSRTTVNVPVALPNGVKVGVEASLGRFEVVRGGERDVASIVSAPDSEVDVASLSGRFEDIAKVVEGVAASLTTAIERMAPEKTSVEFGLEISAESGGLTALIVKGSGTANLKVTLEWSK
jgi:hypothetical protein